MLRSRGGDVAKAAEHGVRCIEAVDLALEAARRFEASPERLKDLRDAWIAHGIYGSDRRGAPVIYFRPGVNDVATFVREVGIDFHHDQEWYQYFLQWDSLYTACSRQQLAIQGHLIVIDLAGLSLRHVLPGKQIAKQLLERPTYPSGEHPMPEGARKIIVSSAPWWIGKLWHWAKMLLPSRTVAKFSLYTTDQAAEFRKELFSRVASEQVPPWLGGQATEPWPYAESESMPKLVKRINDQHSVQSPPPLTRPATL